MGQDPNLLEDWKMRYLHGFRAPSYIDAMDMMNDHQLKVAWHAYKPVIAAYRLNPTDQNQAMEMLYLGMFRGMFHKRGMPMELNWP